MGVGDPIPLVVTLALQPCTQGQQKGISLIGSIGSIV